MQSAQASVTDQFGGAAEMPIGALLAAGLQDAPLLPYGSTHGAPFGNGEGERLLAVDVLAGLRRPNDLDRVPVVGGADLDGVDIVTGQEVAKIAQSVAAIVVPGPLLLGIVPLDDALCRFPPGDATVPVARTLAVGVTDRDDLHPLIS